MDRYEIHASNDITQVLITEKCTLGGALVFATEIAEHWDDIFIRHYKNGSETFNVVARVALKGIVL